MNRISLLTLLLCLSWSIQAHAQVLNNSVIQVGATPSGSCTQGEPSRQIPPGSGGTIYDCVAGSWSARGGGGGSAAGSSGDYQINNGGSFGAGVLAQSSGRLTATPTAASSGVASFFRLITPADTTQTASTESIGAQFGGNTSAATVTRQWASGALTTQRENLFVAPTYSFVGASTLTTAATVAISAAPIAGTNATFTNSYALWVQNGATKYDFSDSATTTASVVSTYGHNSSGTPAAGFGTGIKFQLQSSTTADQDAAQISAVWQTATHASRNGMLKFSGVDGSSGLVTAGYIGVDPGVSTYGGIWLGSAITPSASNYAILSNGTDIIVNGSSTSTLATNNTGRLTASASSISNSTPFYLLSDSTAQFAWTGGPGIARKSSTAVRITDASTGAGQLLIGTSSQTATAQAHVFSSSASTVGLQVEGAASNSAAVIVSKSGSSGTGDLWQGQNSSGTVLAAITSGGRFQIGASGAPVILSGSGSPESAITAPVGSVYLRTDGGASTSFCVKESGSGNTGWACK